ncbi:MAG: SO_0444 family Cu/Zn efflux transporter [Proteobacteria bacterium]|nr:SO_0444 family Cu/Zn efflux transporter [Pseudomonadota bacterium]MBU1711007.1 SO_0444 family Cu/Zn efflux transporter [Pseudomonadota bacterium]
MLLDASLFILFGILIGGLLKVFLSAAFVAQHLGKGKFSSVFKAALFGIPIPLCSCGVLPAAAALKKQGANNGATTAFLISTPESGVDSISITYALLDPIMTIARPVAAFFTAVAAGITENLLHFQQDDDWQRVIDKSCPIDNCCDGKDCPPEEHASHHSFLEKLRSGLNFAINDLWGDLVGWFAAGLLMGGLITTLIPDTFMTRYLGGGIESMLIMLAVGIPMYICATASTPIAAALIIKGVSPGAALVFLLVGPATNITSLSVLFGILGKRATGIYLLSLSFFAVLSGLLLDWIYGVSGISARAIAGQASEVIPEWANLFGAIIAIALSIKPLYLLIKKFFSTGNNDNCGHSHCTEEKHLQEIPLSKPECKAPT